MIFLWGRGGVRCLLSILASSLLNHQMELFCNCFPDGFSYSDQQEFHIWGSIHIGISLQLASWKLRVFSSSYLLGQQKGNSCRNQTAKGNPLSSPVRAGLCYVGLVFSSLSDEEQQRYSQILCAKIGWRYWTQQLCLNPGSKWGSAGTRNGVCALVMELVYFWGDFPCARGGSSPAGGELPAGARCLVSAHPALCQGSLQALLGTKLMHSPWSLGARAG